MLHTHKNVDKVVGVNEICSPRYKIFYCWNWILKYGDYIACNPPMVKGLLAAMKVMHHTAWRRSFPSMVLPLGVIQDRSLLRLIASLNTGLVVLATSHRKGLLAAIKVWHLSTSNGIPAPPLIACRTNGLTALSTSLFAVITELLACSQGTLMYGITLASASLTIL